MREALNKQAYTGVEGRICWYSGDANRGLHIKLSRGDVLSLSPDLIRRLFHDLGSFNPLLQDCRGLASRKPWITTLMDSLARRQTFPERSAGGSTDKRYAGVVSPRLTDWLSKHSRTEFGRPLGVEDAACIQGVLGGEGLLSMEGIRPGEFPVTDVVTAVRSLVGRRMIHEAGRRLTAVTLLDVHAGGADSEYLGLLLGNLRLPGFSQDLPEEFDVGSALEHTSMNPGILSGYMGLYVLVTSPRATDHLIAGAKSGLPERELFTECRRIIYGYRR